MHVDWRHRVVQAAVVASAVVFLLAMAEAGGAVHEPPHNWRVLMALGWTILAIAHLPWRSHP